MTTHDDDALTCDTCGTHLRADKGEAFPTDDGGVYCADHAAEAHFDANEDCPWCCTHLSDIEIRIAMAHAVNDGMSRNDCSKPVRV